MESLQDLLEKGCGAFINPLSNIISLGQTGGPSSGCPDTCYQSLVVDPEVLLTFSCAVVPIRSPEGKLLINIGFGLWL